MAGRSQAARVAGAGPDAQAAQRLVPPVVPVGVRARPLALPHVVRRETRLGAPPSPLLSELDACKAVTPRPESGLGFQIQVLQIFFSCSIIPWQRYASIALAGCSQVGRVCVGYQSVHLGAKTSKPTQAEAEPPPPHRPALT